MPDTMLIKADRVIGENTVNTTVTSTFTLPRAATRIVDIVGSLQNTASTVSANQVQITSTLHKQIYYVGPGDQIYHQAEDVPVTALSEIPGVEEGMTAHVTGRIAGITRTLVGTDQVNQTANLQFFVKVTETQQLNLVMATTGSLYRVRRVVGENTLPSVVEAASELPMPALKIRDIIASLTDVTDEVLTNQVIVRGVVNKDLYYVGTDNVERFFREEVPFTQAIPITGARPGMEAQVHPRIERVDRELGTETTVNQRVTLSTFAKVSEIVQVRLATAATGPLLRVQRVVAENIKQIMIESTACLSMPATKVRNIQASITSLTHQVIRDKVIIEGTLHKQIFYVGPGDVVNHQPEDVLFSTFLDIAGARPGMQVQINSTVEHVNFDLVTDMACPPLDDEVTTRGVHQRVVAEFFVKVTEEAQIRTQVAGGMIPQG